MYKYAILIDAGFLKKKLRNKAPSGLVDTDLILDFVKLLKAKINEIIDDKTYLYRIYYYDGDPADTKVKNPISNHKTDLQQTDTYKANIRIISKLKISPGFAIRLGECVFRGWNVRKHKLKKNDGQGNVIITHDDLVLNIQQKGVDMRIGLDVATLTLKKQVDGIVLVTGDSDFIPPMKFARKEGVQLILCAMNHNVKPQMYEHSDFSIKL